MADALSRAANIPLLTNLILSSAVGGVIWWKFYTFDIKKAWVAANETVNKERASVFQDAQKTLKEGLATSNVSQVIVGTSKSYVAANSFGPLYSLGAMIQNAFKK